MHPCERGKFDHDSTAMRPAWGVEEARKKERRIEMGILSFYPLFRSGTVCGIAEDMDENRGRRPRRDGQS